MEKQSFIYHHDATARIEFANGHYELSEPMHAEIHGQDILYCLGNALLDNSCCGNTGCAYALVIGESLTGAQDAAPPQVRPIDAESAQAERIRTALLEREAIGVVNFYVPAPATADGAGS